MQISPPPRIIEARMSNRDTYTFAIVVALVSLIGAKLLGYIP